MTKEEIREAFKRLMRQRGITPTWSQDQAIQQTRDDPLSKLLKMSEKKAMFSNVVP